MYKRLFEWTQKMRETRIFSKFEMQAYLAVRTSFTIYWNFRFHDEVFYSESIFTHLCIIAFTRSNTDKLQTNWVR